MTTQHNFTHKSTDELEAPQKPERQRGNKTTARLYENSRLGHASPWNGYPPIVGLLFRYYTYGLYSVYMFIYGNNIFNGICVASKAWNCTIGRLTFEKRPPFRGSLHMRCQQPELDFSPRFLGAPFKGSPQKIVRKMCRLMQATCEAIKIMISAGLCDLGTRLK